MHRPDANSVVSNDGLDDVHLVLTEQQGRWTLTSPQLADLLFEAAPGDGPLRCMSAAEDYAENSTRHFDVTHVHEQHFVEDTDGKSYIIRWSVLDNCTKVPATHLISRALSERFFSDRQSFLPPENVDGHRLLLIAMPSDTIGWVVDQLEPDGCATLCIWSEGAIEVVLLGWGPTKAARADLRDVAAALGVNRESTVGALEHLVFAHGYEELATRFRVHPHRGRAWNTWTVSLGFLKGARPVVSAMFQPPD